MAWFSYFDQKEEITRQFKSSFLYMIFLYACGIAIWLAWSNPIALYFGLFGCAINFIVDYFIWYKWWQIRQIQNVPSPLRFFLLFSVYGIFQFSYAIILFQQDLFQIMLFSALLFLGLYAWGEVSKDYGHEIHISRYISPKHWITRILCVLGLYLILYFQTLDWMLIGILFGIGCMVELGLEIPLLLNGSRAFYFRQFSLNILFEFNLGIPILYWIYQFVTG